MYQFHHNRLASPYDGSAKTNTLADRLIERLSSILLRLVSYFFFLYQSPSLSLCTVSNSISSNIDEVPSINPSANMLVFEDFNIHHKDSLTYCGETDRPGELCYNFSVSNDLTQMVNFPTQILDCDCHSPAYLNLIISSDTSICSKIVFPPFRNSDHVLSVSIQKL